MSKKSIRNKFRESVLERDNYKCKMCGDTNSKLDAHHITNRNEMPNGGYVLENGISLCDKPNGCHVKAEMYNMSNEPFDRNLNHYKYQEYSPENLYKLINSNYKLAYKKSEML